MLDDSLGLSPEGVRALVEKTLETGHFHYLNGIQNSFAENLRDTYARPLEESRRAAILEVHRRAQRALLLHLAADLGVWILPEAPHAENIGLLPGKGAERVNALYQRWEAAKSLDWGGLLPASNKATIERADRDLHQAILEAREEEESFEARDLRRLRWEE